MRTHGERLAVLESVQEGFIGHTRSDIAEIKDLVKVNSEATMLAVDKLSVEIEVLKQSVAALKVQRLVVSLGIAVVAFFSGSPEKSITIIKGVLF